MLPSSIVALVIFRPLGDLVGFCISMAACMRSLMEDLFLQYIGLFAYLETAGSLIHQSFVAWWTVGEWESQEYAWCERPAHSLTSSGLDKDDNENHVFANRKQHNFESDINTCKYLHIQSHTHEQLIPVSRLVAWLAKRCAGLDKVQVLLLWLTNAHVHPPVHCIRIHTHMLWTDPLQDKCFPQH